MPLSRRLTSFACMGAAAALLAACAPMAGTRLADTGGAAVAASAGPFIAPNANLHVEGIPPVPASIAADVARYSDFRGQGFVGWHPLRAEMLVAYRSAGRNTVQLHRVSAALATPEPLTDFADPVRSASFDPLTGESLVFERSSGGDEAAQLYRLVVATGQVTQITEPGERHDMQAWLHRSARLFYLSVPLDRTAAGRSREGVEQRLTLVDPAEPEARRRIGVLPGGGWSVSSVAWSDRQATLTRYLSATQSEVWLLDLASGERRRLLPAPGATSAVHTALAWKRDDSGFFFLSDRTGEFRELMFYRLADGAVQRVSRGLQWDVDSASLDASGRLLAVRANVEGRGELRFFDAESFDELPQPALPASSLVGASFHPRLPLLAVTVTDARSPSRVGVLDPASGAVQPWTVPAAPPGVDLAAFGEQSVVRWKGHDGLALSGIVNLPPPRFTGKRPVLIEIHGGPEEQARFGFIGNYNYFVEELGIAVVRPNVRGSSGFGKTFLSLDDGMKREDSVRDIGALLDWIATQPTLDASRVVVSGGSYGGYMSLAVATREPGRIAGAIDRVGISNIASFLQNTESYRRDLRRVEYGDERDPAMREFMLRTAPLTNAGRITKPLFVVQGRNDPRVPYTEAEQIVASVRANGTRVWYLRAENEGHGFARKENADWQFYATVMFLRETLLLK